jgi:hypothetical protein
MTTINISGKVNQAETWCILHIDQRRYHIAFKNGWRFGGVGWEIRRESGTSTLAIEDEQMLMIAVLSI